MTIHRRKLITKKAWLARELEDIDGLGWTLYLFGGLAVAKGEYARAMQYYAEALQICRNVKSGPVTTWITRSMAQVAMLLGDMPLAQTYCQESLELNWKMGDRKAVATTYFRLGHISLRQGDYQHTAIVCAQGLRLALEIENADAIAQGLAGFGLLAEVGGHSERAARLFGAAQAIHPVYISNVWRSVVSDIQGAIEALRTRLGEVAFQAVWDEGGALTREQACAYALEINDR